MQTGFVRIARVDQVAPGKMARIDVEGRRILLAHVDGTFYATDDTCTHEDASLSTGCLHAATVKCPLHGSRFDLSTGRPLDEPAEDPLTTYELRIKGEDVLLRIG